MKRLAPSFRAISSRGFTLVEMIIVVFLLALAMLGILSVFDASARINKSESDVADAQGAVRYGIYSMTKAIRMAGAGGLYVTQAVLNHADQQLPGIVIDDPFSYDNVPAGTQVMSLNGLIDVRPGTDMIEIRGVINSPLIGFDLSTGCEPCNPESDPSGGCAPCVGSDKAVKATATTHTPHVNDDMEHSPNQRPQFSQIDDYTAGVTDANRMYVIVAFNDDVHSLCSTGGTPAYSLYPQSPYNVGAIKARTRLVTASTFGLVDFTDARAMQFNYAPGGTEIPDENGAPPLSMKNVRHAGILDDLIFFIDNGTDPGHAHPSLAQGIRRGDAFDVVTLAEDVEDMQIAYGVDIDGNSEINRLTPPAPTPADPEPNTSFVAEKDEWVPNVPGADNPITHSTIPFAARDFYDLPNLCPRLHAVMITLVAKSHDPDLTYKAPSALGIRVMNSPVTAGVPPRPVTAQYPDVPNPSFRRRVQTLKINLRNYSYQALAPAP